MFGCEIVGVVVDSFRFLDFGGFAQYLSVC